MWAAMILYDEGRLGHVGCFGFKSRADAIFWLNHDYMTKRNKDWSRNLYLLPSCWVKNTAAVTQDKRHD